MISLWTAWFILFLLTRVLSKEGTSPSSITHFIFRSHSATFEELDPLLHNVLNDTLALNPAFVQVYFNEEDRTEFISRFYPDLLPLYEYIIPGAYRSDLWRLLVLHRYGGFYMDLGMRSLAPLHSIKGVGWGASLMTFLDIEENCLAQGFLASSPRNPLLSFFIGWVTDNVYHRRHGCTNLDITGPMALGKAFNRFANRCILDNIAPGYHSISLPSCASSVHDGPGTVTGFPSSHRRNHTRTMTAYLLRYHKDATASDCADCSKEDSSLPSSSSNRVTIFRNKFKGYQQAIYSKNQPYGVYFYYRNVYNASKVGPSIPPATGMFDGGVIQSGRQFWYVVNNTRVPFPNYDTFLQLRMNQCATCAVKFENALALPIRSATDQAGGFVADDMAHNVRVLEKQYPSMTTGALCPSPSSASSSASSSFTKGQQYHDHGHDHPSSPWLQRLREPNHHKHRPPLPAKINRVLAEYRGATITAKVLFAAVED